MDAEIHELSAGYALDALDPEERDAYERHLAGCRECQEELASFWEVAEPSPLPPTAPRRARSSVTASSPMHGPRSRRSSRSSSRRRISRCSPR